MFKYNVETLTCDDNIILLENNFITNEHINLLSKFGYKTKLRIYEFSCKN